MRFLQKIKNADVKRIKLFGITIYKRVRKDLFFYYYLMGIKCFKRDLKLEFYNKIKKYVKNYDKIYVLNSNIGEVYLFFKYFANSIISSDKSLVIATKKSHIDVINSLKSKCKYILFEKADLNLFPDVFSVKGKKFYVFFTHKYYVELEKDIREGHEHYFERMQEIFSGNQISINKVNINEDIELSLSKKITEINLNSNNFVIIIPESNSCSDLDEAFVKQITYELKKKGYDVFFNTNTGFSESIGCKSCFLNLQELFKLSEMAKAVIGVRCGLMEYIAESGTPAYVIYKSFKNRLPEEFMSAQKAYDGFSLAKLPENGNRINEYILNDLDDYEIITRSITEDICKIQN